MKVEIDYKFGQAIYLKNDPEQSEFLLNRIILLPKGSIVLELMSNTGECFEVWEGLVSKEPDILVKTGADKQEE